MDFRGIATSNVSFERHVSGRKRQGTIKYGGSNGLCFQMPRTTFACTSPDSLRLTGCQPQALIEFWNDLMHRFRVTNGLEHHPFQAAPPLQFRVAEDCCVFDSEAEVLKNKQFEVGTKYTGGCIVKLDKTWMTFDDTNDVISWGLSASITQFKVDAETKPTPQFFLDGKALFLED